MNNDVERYLERIGIQAPLRQRIFSLRDQVGALLSIDFKELFVEDAISDGNRVYSDVWFFNDEVFAAVGLIGPETRFVTASLNSIHSVDVRSQDFDPAVPPTSASRMRVTVPIGEFELEMVATGDNCTVLAEILRIYLMRSVKTRRDE